jgi:hypothetical protein
VTDLTRIADILEGIRVELRRTNRANGLCDQTLDTPWGRLSCALYENFGVSHTEHEAVDGTTWTAVEET